MPGSDPHPYSQRMVTNFFYLLIQTTFPSRALQSLMNFQKIFLHKVNLWLLSLHLLWFESEKSEQYSWSCLLYKCYTLLHWSRVVFVVFSWFFFNRHSWLWGQNTVSAGEKKSFLKSHFFTLFQIRFLNSKAALSLDNGITFRVTTSSVLWY